jgi:hypothetical protein
MQLDCECLQFFSLLINIPPLLHALHCHHSMRGAVALIMPTVFKLRASSIWPTIWPATKCGSCNFFSLAVQRVLLSVLLPARHIAFSCLSKCGMSVFFFCTVCSITRWFLDCIFMYGFNCIYSIPCLSLWSSYHWTWCYVLLVMPLLEAFLKALCFELNILTCFIMMTLSSTHPHEQQAEFFFF